MERRQGSVDRDSLDGPSILRSSSQRSSIYDPPVDSDRDSFIDFESELGPFIAADRTSLPLRPKPPLPTVPVPDHLRRRSHLPPPQHSHTHPMPSTDTMPPTTNYLQPTQRAQLVKKTRKLAQVFGQTPGAAALDPSGIKQQQGAVRKLPSVQRRKRDITPWPAADDDGTTTIQLTANGRRHSEPTTPVSDEGPSFSRMSISSAPDSPRSFIDFDTTQELEVDDTASVLTRTTIPPSPSAFSVRTLSPEEQAEEDRRRKREKLAKLHRFLGSRVPANLVLGIDFYDTLPPTSPGMGPEDPDALRKTFLMRRRSSSAAVLTTWSDDIDRLKEELGDKEKAIIVRRAQKMEKVFGVAPPQKLFSAKHASSTTSTPHGTFPRSAPGSPVTTYTAPALNPYTIGFNVTTTTTTTTNPNQGSYKRSGRARPSTAESGDGGGGGSFVYTHYQHSLNSLHDILDRNDKESLAELHQYLNDSSAAPPTPPSATGAYAAYTPSPQPSPSAYTHAHTRTARRRSLPANARASMSSLANTFQARRRRAAKLTQFFGVDYRDLIEDVLESIENGLDAERSRGTLGPDEAEELLHKLRTLKTKRT
ncbi:hypothetical protein C8J57DRAFT_1042662 [Mycena rebaudengoi]|nr:hypothetical protein C8J57DRAFT_1042662 [Mycena rebaudengoi]